jgi:SAM dependent carboxyl methyltransferase
MSVTSLATHGVMEGKGAYNRHGSVAAGGGNLAAPLLEQAARNIAIERGNQPIVVADYGSSQGKNSLAPMRTAIEALRDRVGPDRPICVVHVDQPANDFNTLFEVLHRDPERYSVNDPNVFFSAIGRSFYESVFPKGQVHLGWSSYAAVWLSRIPMLIPGHFIVVGSTGDVREAFERQAAGDWEAFLSLRASELSPGGRLVVVLPGVEDEGASGFEPLFRHANDVLSEMVAEGAVTLQERAHMVLGAYPRRSSELLAPFRTDGQFRGLVVEHCHVLVLPDAAWADYQRDGDKDLFSARHARFFRSTFAPSLASAITDKGKRPVFADRLEEKLKRRLTQQPVPLNSFVQTIVLAKPGTRESNRWISIIGVA